MAPSADDFDRKSTLSLKKGCRPAMLIILLLVGLVALSLLIFGDSFFEPFFALTS
jgi:hypothetical protein